MTAFMVFKYNLLQCSYGRVAKGGGRSRYELKRHRYAALFLSGSELSALEKGVK
jgi:hypothetical protein